MNHHADVLLAVAKERQNDLMRQATHWRLGRHTRDSPAAARPSGFGFAALIRPLRRPVRAEPVSP